MAHALEYILKCSGDLSMGEIFSTSVLDPCPLCNMSSCNHSYLINGYEVFIQVLAS
jgi:hypothetical protein